MARLPRTDFEGAKHHVYTRGNNKQRIFCDDQDYRTYLQRLAVFKAETGVKLLASCPMPNHSHMVTDTGPQPLEFFMKKLNSSYTRLYNDRWVAVGHVLQGRYGARRCKTDAQLMAAIRYVHMNPVKDGLVAKPENWPWSSHRGILAGHDPIVDVPAVLDLFGGLTSYLDFLALPSGNDSRRPLEEIIADFTLEEASLIRGSGRSQRAAHLRRSFVVLAREEGYRYTELGKFLGRSASAVALWVRG